MKLGIAGFLCYYNAISVSTAKKMAKEAYDYDGKWGDFSPTIGTICAESLKDGELGLTGLEFCQVYKDKGYWVTDKDFERLEEITNGR